jgi:lon-related putative ATP-dependent protease
MNNKNSLAPEALYNACSIDQFEFETTADLEPLQRPLGQKRALDAIEFGVDIEQDGYNLFVLGSSGLGKHRLVKEILEQRAAKEPAPPDWCYINNFEDPQRPKILKLPAGQGQPFRKDLEQLIEELLTALPSSLQSEEFSTRRQEIQKEFEEREEAAFRELDKQAKDQGIALLRTPAGYTLTPKKDGKLLGPEEFNKLPNEERHRLENIIADIQLSLRDLIQGIPIRQREFHQRVKALQKEVTQFTIDQLIGWLENKYRDQPLLQDYIANLKENVIENIQDFQPEEGNTDLENVARRVEEFHPYHVNVLVDNTQLTGTPVLFEDNPTYQNLIGRVERISQMGTLLTDFTLIKAGALHRANGGYLVLDARKVLSHAFAWDGLKRALMSREIKIESLEEMLSLVSTLSLEPEPIPIDTKVVLTGEPLLYYLLKEYDPEFSLLFKVAADFSDETGRSGESTQLYARLIASLQTREKLKPLDKGAVGRVIEQAARMAEDAEKLSLHVETLGDLLREANYCAEKANSDTVRAHDIEQAIEKRRYRQDKIREQMQEQITRGIQFIDTDKNKVAQVNGLSVIQLSDYSFGRPMRITATARLGDGKLIDIEREAKLGGHLHSKGVLILSSYLANHYARDCPLPLSASLVFEQSYGKVDGDSASAAELCVLLSALGDISLKQSFAITGSINQLGEVQPIGGVNEKIEGFFDLCQARGLTGEQGVIIPASNQVHLMLRRDVREAVTRDKFHIYTIQHVEEAMELLSGLPCGKRDHDGKFSQGSFNRIIEDRIDTLRQLHKQYAENGESEESNDT